MQKRRVVRIDISMPLLIDMMSEDYVTDGPIRTIEGIPDDSVFISSTHDPARDLTSLFFAHDSFDEVLDGTHPPTKNISHELDYTMLDLLHRWYRIVEVFRQDDHMFDAVVYPKFKDVSEATYKYLINPNEGSE